MATPDDLRAAYEALVRLGRAKAAECAAVAAHRVERTSGSHWRITLAESESLAALGACRTLADRLAAEAERGAGADDSDRCEAMNGKYRCTLSKRPHLAHCSVMELGTPFTWPAPEYYAARGKETKA